MVLRGEGGDFVPPHPLGHLAMSGDTDDCHNQGRKISELGGGARTLLSQPPHNKEHQTQNVHSAEVEKCPSYPRIVPGMWQGLSESFLNE